MMNVGLIALTFFGLVVAPCAIGLRIRASLHHGVPRTTVEQANR